MTQPDNHKSDQDDHCGDQQVSREWVVENLLHGRLRVRDKGIYGIYHVKTLQEDGQRVRKRRYRLWVRNPHGPAPVAVVIALGNALFLITILERSTGTMKLRFSLLPLFVFLPFWVILRSFSPTSSETTAPSDEDSATPVIEECSFTDEIPAVEDYMSLVSFGDPYKGNFDAEVTVIEFFDVNCPHCRTFHPIMEQVVEDSGAHARFFMIPFVLWQYSLLQTEALFVAAQDGLYFEMLQAQYDNQKQGGMNMDELTVLAGDIGLDQQVFRQRLERGLNQRMILERRQQISETGVRGTPSVMINGRFISSDSKSRVCLNQLIAETAADKG